MNVSSSVGAARAAGTAAYWLWVVALVVFGAVLGIRHWVALPRPSDHVALGQALATLRGPAEHGLTVVHVLYADCRCSRRILDVLARREAVPDRTEKVLLVGDLPETEKGVSARGIEVVHVGTEELRERFHVEAAPMFVVLDATDHVRYVGGYTEHKQGLLPRDRVIADAVARGEAPPPLPVFGCAVSDRLRRASYSDAIP